MSILKVSIYQKDFNEPLNLSISKKLAALRSDFLILPEYFYSARVADANELVDRSGFAQDWLCKLNEAYGGVTIGGTILREEMEFIPATPILSEGEIVDWYQKRNLHPFESNLCRTGEEPGVFILGGHRFAVLSGADLLNDEYFEHLAQNDIRLIFAPAIMIDEDPDETEERLARLARDLEIYIVRCSGTGDLVGQRVRGRSLVASPTGISWRVAESEEDKELLKTVMINVAMPNRA